jgi:hypothetical protein
VIDTNLPQLLEKSFPVPETGCEYVKGGGFLSVTAALDDAYKALGGDVNSGSLPLGEGQPPLLTAAVSAGPQATQTLKRDLEGRLELQVLIPLYDGACRSTSAGRTAPATRRPRCDGARSSTASGQWRR